ncbi:hypothetical protein [Cellulomonas sp. S1-8]|uniref:hypothetical protein n=1 Tax=Cellulomonas sp. S1-8 TaxID=2904790 RepID=UPI0022441D92|nr:hypothetical protein [Cellulomonas sp. S1-8]UZN01690.1 hypothetical protein OKX07_11305 [Cellulomonas sp. S1-8]
MAAERGAHRPTGAGPGRLLVAVYGVLALAATARGLYQVATKLAEAPVAYLLSLLAGLVYLVATYALARDRRRLAWAAVAFELVGVLTVGTLSVVDVGDLPDETVWSQLGAGYGYVPLVLPFVGLWWLWRTGRPTPGMDVPASDAPPAVG